MSFDTMNEKASMMQVVQQNELIRSAWRWAIGGFALTLALLGAIALNAQAIAGHNSNAPVDFGADRIEFQDRQNRVMLSGNVVIKQAGLTLNAQRTLLNFTDNDAVRIQRLTATGGVRVNRGNEAASGDVAVYDFNRRIITMSGNVRLNRGSDTLNGGRLVIDLASGISSVDGSAAGSTSMPGTERSSDGRVTGSFAQ